MPHGLRAPQRAHHLAGTAWADVMQSIAPRCNAERSSAIAQRCFSARLVELIEPMLEPPPQLWDDMSAQYHSNQVSINSRY